MDELTLALILWMVSAIGAYMVANSRNDPSPGMWAFIGFILGPLGFLLALVAAKPRKVDVS